MAYQLPVKYFNSFWLKKVVDDGKQWGSQGAAVSNGGLTPNESEKRYWNSYNDVAKIT